MTDNEIIKALKCCISCENCDICPQHSTECVSDLLKLAYDLITYQQAEIERLKIENQAFRSAANSYKLHYNEARTEAVKEFAERLKESKKKYEGTLAGWTFTMTELDNLVKEMAGDTE